MEEIQKKYRFDHVVTIRQGQTLTYTDSGVDFVLKDTCKDLMPGDQGHEPDEAEKHFDAAAYYRKIRSRDPDALDADIEARINAASDRVIREYAEINAKYHLDAPAKKVGSLAGRLSGRRKNNLIEKAPEKEDLYDMPPEYINEDDDLRETNEKKAEEADAYLLKNMLDRIPKPNLSAGKTQANDSDTPEEQLLPDVDYSVKLDQKNRIQITATDGQPIRDRQMLARIKASEEFKEARQTLLNDQRHERYSRYSEIIDENNRFRGMQDEIQNTPQTVTAYESKFRSYRPNVYRRRQFDVPEPDEYEIEKRLRKEAEKLYSHIPVWSKDFWSRKSKIEEYVDERLARTYRDEHTKWIEDRLAFEAEEDRRVDEYTSKYLTQYSDASHAVMGLVSGDENVIYQTLDKWFSSITMPAPVTVSYRFLLLTQSIYLDIDLPDISCMPKSTASWSQVKELKEHTKTDMELNTEYAEYVLGTALFFASHIFNQVPMIQKIYCSGYQYSEDISLLRQGRCIFSLMLRRENMGDAMITEDILQYCMTDENKIEFSMNYDFKTIFKPFAPD